MSDLEYSAGNKVEITNKHKLISGKTNKNAGEIVPGSEEFFRISKKPLVEKSSPNGLPELPGHGKHLKNQQLGRNQDSDSSVSRAEMLSDEDMELGLLIHWITYSLGRWLDTKSRRLTNPGRVLGREVLKWAW